MTLFTHIAATAIGTASHYITNKFFENSNHNTINDNNEFLNIFARASEKDELGKAYSMSKIFSVLDSGRKDIQDPRSDLGAKQIHKLCIDNFGEDLCNDSTEAFMVTYCNNFNNLDTPLTNDHYVSLISGVGAFIAIECLLG